MTLTNDKHLTSWFAHSLVAREMDIDANGHVNNVVYLRWVQEAAVAHWKSVASADVMASISWVVVRHEIDYKKPAFRGDPVVARTRVDEITAATTVRICEIVRGDGGDVLAKSRTIWCAIDPRTGRPRRIDAVIRAYFCAL
jgi:acyl-CoA thioester hydrolase